MSTDEGAAAVAKVPRPATGADWGKLRPFTHWPVVCCLWDLRRRVEALEAAGGVAGNPGHAPSVPAGGVAVDCLPPISPAVWVGIPADVAPQVVPTTSTVLTVDELADCLPANAWAGPEGYSRQAFARHLLDHPRIGPLLRGEGAAAPVRVVLPEKPPMTGLYWVSHDYRDGYRDCWAAARAEVERQQGTQLPQTQEKSNDY